MTKLQQMDNVALQLDDGSKDDQDGVRDPDGIDRIPKGEPAAIDDRTKIIQPFPRPTRTSYEESNPTNQWIIPKTGWNSIEMLKDSKNKVIEAKNQTSTRTGGRGDSINQSVIP